MLYRKITLTLVILVGFIRIAVSQGVNVELLGSLMTNDSARDVVITCGYAFIATYLSEGLAIIDITNLENPTQVGSFIDPGYARGVDVSGNYAFLATTDGLLVIDWSDPHHPLQVGELRLDGLAGSKIVISGEYAYYANAGNNHNLFGLYIFNISQPIAPTLMSICRVEILPPAPFYDVAVRDNLAFVALYYDGIGIIDISDPLSPELIGTYDIPGYQNYSIKVANQYVYVAYGDAGLRILDVSDPTDPIEVGSYFLHFATDVAIANGFAVVACQLDDNLHIINIEDPTTPFEVGNHYTPGNSLAVAVSGNTAFLADGAGGFQIYDFSDAVFNPQPPPQPEMLVIPLAANYFELVSTYLFQMIFDPVQIFGGIRDLVIVYQNDGGIFIPPNLNTIGIFDHTQGYQIFCSDTSAWVSTGRPILLDARYSLTADTWNWLGNPFAIEIPVEAAFTPVVDIIRIVLTDDGRYWIPGLVNSLGNMRPGEGYMVFATEDVEFQYEGEVVTAASLDDDLLHGQPGTADHTESQPGTADRTENQPGTADHTENQPGTADRTENQPGTADRTGLRSPWTTSSPGHPTETGLPYAVIVRLSEEMKARNPAVIELYDGALLVGKSVVLPENEGQLPGKKAMPSEDEGQLPGKKVVQSEDEGQLLGKEAVLEECPENYNIPSMNNNNIIPLTAWGGSPELGLPGFITGHPITVKALTSDGKIMADMTTAEKFGEGAYAEIILDTFSYIASPIVPSEFVVGCAYPNPFNPTLTIPFALPRAGEVSITLFNLLGQKVFQTIQIYTSGQHRFDFDASIIGRELVSGMYFLRLQFEDQLHAQKVMLLK